ncbi:MAG: 3-deoxy-D-manno-octulosonic acid transferase [Acidobacteria bacterium]|nr:3-deoxy-D-manno-octulosonic acid transferase [Acidobacteriota bacterium]
MYILYSILLAVGFVLALPWFLWKGRRTGKYIRTFRERMGALPVYLNVDGDRSIWIHAVSVGEVLGVRPLIPALRERFPDLQLFLSTTTVTGNEVAAKKAGDLDGLCFAPFDWPGPVRRALTTLNPALLVLVETELWPNLIHEAHRRGTRVAVVNGRISDRSFGRYRIVRPFLRRVLEEIDLFLMQGEIPAARIRDLGAPAGRVSIAHSLKYDAAEPGRPPERLTRLFDGRSPPRPLWVAGSTVGGEEECVLQAFHRVRERVKDAALLIAPRHPERFGEVPPLVEAAGFRCRRRSALEPGGWREGDVLLLDTLGELAPLYTLASVVFVGGSLAATGGHNILEPAAAAKPVIVGPHLENFQEIADEFKSDGALIEVKSAEELGREVADLLLDEPRRRELGERARRLVERNRGAVQRTVDALGSLIA